MTAPRKTVEALRLLHDAARQENRGESDPIRVRVTKDAVAVIRHAADGSMQECAFELPEGSHDRSGG